MCVISHLLGKGYCKYFGSFPDSVFVINHIFSPHQLNIHVQGQSSLLISCPTPWVYRRKPFSDKSAWTFIVETCFPQKTLCIWSFIFSASVLMACPTYTTIFPVFYPLEKSYSHSAVMPWIRLFYYFLSHDLKHIISSHCIGILNWLCFHLIATYEGRTRRSTDKFEKKVNKENNNLLKI